MCSAVVYSITWLTFARRAFTRFGRWFRVATTIAIVLLIVVLFAIAMLR